MNILDELKKLKEASHSMDPDTFEKFWKSWRGTAFNVANRILEIETRIEDRIIFLDEKPFYDGYDSGQEGVYEEILAMLRGE